MLENEARSQFSGPILRRAHIRVPLAGVRARLSQADTPQMRFMESLVDVELCRAEP